MPQPSFERSRDLFLAAGLPRRLAELRAHGAERRRITQRPGGPDQRHVPPTFAPAVPDRGRAVRSAPLSSSLAESADFLTPRPPLDTSLVPARGQHAFNAYSAAIMGADSAAVRRNAAQRAHDAAALAASLHPLSETPDTLASFGEVSDMLDTVRGKKLRTGFETELHERGYGGVWDESLHPRGPDGAFVEANGGGPTSTVEKAPMRVGRAGRREFTPEQVDRIAAHGRKLAAAYKAKQAAKRGTGNDRDRTPETGVEKPEGSSASKLRNPQVEDRPPTGEAAPAMHTTKERSPDKFDSVTGDRLPTGEAAPAMHTGSASDPAAPAPAAKTDSAARAETALQRIRAERAASGETDEDRRRALDDEEEAAELSTTGRATPATRREVAANREAEAAAKAAGVDPRQAALDRFAAVSATVPGLDPAERGSTGNPAVDTALDQEAERQAREENGEAVPPPVPDDGISATEDQADTAPTATATVTPDGPAPVTVTAPSPDAPATAPPGTVPGEAATNASQDPTKLSPGVPEAPATAAQAPDPTAERQGDATKRARGSVAATATTAKRPEPSTAAAYAGIGRALLDAGKKVAKAAVSTSLAPVVPLTQSIVRKKVRPLIRESVLARARAALDEAAAWDETKYERDQSGRFASKGGGETDPSYRVGNSDMTIKGSELARSAALDRAAASRRAQYGQAYWSEQEAMHKRHVAERAFGVDLSRTEQRKKQ